MHIFCSLFYMIRFLFVLVSFFSEAQDLDSVGRKINFGYKDSSEFVIKKNTLDLNCSEACPLSRTLMTGVLCLMVGASAILLYNARSK